MKIINLAQNTPEWHAWRNEGIGGSDSSSVLQESPYMTKRELFLAKKGLLKKETGSEYIFSHGHKAEAQMRKEIKDLLGSDFPPLCIQHPALDYMRASLDGFSSQFGILEAKLVGKEVLKRVLETGEIPRHHWIQMQHNMIAAEVDSGKWFGSTLANNGAVVDIALEKGFAQKLVDEEDKFWDMVLKNILPELSDRDTLEPDETDLFVTLRALKWKLDRTQEEYDAVLEGIKKKYSHPRVSCAGVDLVTVERAGSISYSKIPELKKLPSEYLETFRGSPTKYVKVTFKDGVDEK